MVAFGRTFVLFIAFVLGSSLSEAVSPQALFRIPSFPNQSLIAKLSYRRQKGRSSRDDEEDLSSSLAFYDATFESEIPSLLRLSILSPNLLIARPWLPILVVSGIVVAKCRQSDAVTRALYFWRHAAPIVAHYKFTQKWVEITNPAQEKRDRIYKDLHDRYCSPALDIILNLKGLYAKIGQVLSSRPDFMPPQYIEKFSIVQDSIPQWPMESIKNIVETSLQAEHGLEWDDVFESMDPIALGSASIGQVHRAVLKSPCPNEDDEYTGGNTVAVKVMHPGAQFRFACDFQVFRWLSRIALPGWMPFLAELERNLMREFDYRNEAANLARVRNNIAKSPYRKKVCVPQPFTTLCCKEVLVMELLNGKKLSDAFEDRLAAALGTNREVVDALIEKKKREMFDEGSSDTEQNGSEAATTSVLDELELTTWSKMKLLLVHRKITNYINLLLEVHGHQIFIDGCFNADPHPGNVMELEDGKTLGLIDYGQTRILLDEDRLGIAKIVAALGACSNDDIHGDSKNAQQVSVYMRNLGFRTKFDNDAMLYKYARMMFDSDVAGKILGHATPQLYFKSLMDADPLTEFPDSFVMVARLSVLFRGIAAVINKPVHTCDYWSKHAIEALECASIEV